MSPFEAVSTAHQSAPRTIAQKAGEFLTLSFGPQHRNKLIAQALNCSPDMAKGLRRGDYWTVDRLEQVRRICGLAFADYVFGTAAAPAVHPQHFWATDRAIVQAPAGHDEYFRRLLGIPATMEGDFALVAMRNHGWVAVTRTGDQVEIKHSARMMKAGAGRIASDWLHQNAADISTIRRTVEVERDWIEATHRSAAAAIEAIEGATAIAAAPARPWTVERLSETGTLPTDVRTLLHAHAESPATSVFELAANTGIMDRCTVMRVGDEVVAQHLGSKLYRLERRTEEPVGNMADAGFAATIRRQMFEIVHDGQPVVHRLTGMLNGSPVDYLRPAIPQPIGGGAWHVLTLPHILETAA